MRVGVGIRANTRAQHGWRPSLQHLQPVPTCSPATPDRPGATGRDACSANQASGPGSKPVVQENRTQQRLDGSSMLQQGSAAVLQGPSLSTQASKCEVLAPQAQRLLQEAKQLLLELQGQGQPLGGAAANAARMASALCDRLLRGSTSTGGVEGPAMLAAILVPCLLLGPSQSQQFQALAGEDIMLMARETLLILRAAEELSMDGRSLADWTLQSCSHGAAVAATLCAQLGLHASGTNLLPAFKDLSKRLRLRPSTAAAGADAVRAPASTSSSSQQQQQQPGTSFDLQSGSQQQAGSPAALSATASSPSSALLQPLQASGIPQDSFYRSSSSEGIGGGSQGGGPLMEPQGPQRRSLLERPQRTISSDDEDWDSASDEEGAAGPGSSSAGQGPMWRGSPRPQAGRNGNSSSSGNGQGSDQDYWERISSFEEDEEWGDEDEEGWGPGGPSRAQQPRRPPPPPRIARALPLQLLPLSQTGALHDPETFAPLAVPPDPAAAAAGTAGSGGGQGQGQQQGLALPLVGPWVLSNNARAFPSSDALLLYESNRSPVEDRLAIRLEYVIEREDDIASFAQQLRSSGSSTGSGPSGAGEAGWNAPDDAGGLGSQSEGSWGPAADGGPSAASSSSFPAPQQGRPAPVATLHLFNISRRARGRTDDCIVLVDSPASAEEGRGMTQAAVRPGDQGLALRPGDVITLGRGPHAPRFKVAVLGGGPRSSQSLIQAAVARYCGDALAQLQQRGPGGSGSAAPGGASSSSGSGAGRRGSGSGSRSSPSPPQLPSLAQVAYQARSDPKGADAGYQLLLASRESANPFAWIAWAQVAARLGQLRKARDLFRTAVAAAAPPNAPGEPGGPGDLLMGGLAQGPEAAAVGGLGSRQGWPPIMQQPQGFPQQQQPQDGWSLAWPSAGAGGAFASSSASAAGSAGGSMSGSGGGAPPPGPGPVAFMQALFMWGRFEWFTAKLYGSARHLFRAAADAARLHPGGPAAGGVGMVLHAWASAELERDNVLNARVVVAEALRKCPQDQPLYVLAAGVELAGGDLNLSRGFCLRAYELNRTDKHLYLVWPRVMAALGERDKARVLFERGLEYHPQNLKILKLYADFESDAGDADFARELHDRALSIDSESLTSMHNRVAWAKLEMDEGDLGLARQLVEEGLEMHPGFVPALLAKARLERLCGDLAGAQVALRQVAKLTHAFDTALLKERAKLYKALGEPQLAASIEMHAKGSEVLQSAKRAGVPTAEAWRGFKASMSDPKRRQVANQARARKVELGWLDAPGVPGAKASRKGGPGWYPLPGRLPPRKRDAAAVTAAAEAALASGGEEAAEEAVAQAQAQQQGLGQAEGASGDLALAAAAALGVEGAAAGDGEAQGAAGFAGEAAEASAGARNGNGSNGGSNGSGSNSNHSDTGPVSAAGGARARAGRQRGSSVAASTGPASPASSSSSSRRASLGPAARVGEDGPSSSSSSSSSSRVTRSGSSMDGGDRGSGSYDEGDDEDDEDLSAPQLARTRAAQDERRR